MPRFIMFVRATAESESARLPNHGELEAMGEHNASMADAGILESGEGLLSSSRDSCRIAFHNSDAPTVRSGPFPAHELVSGWWIVKAKDVEEVVSWAKKCPFKEGGVIEVRRIAEMDDFGEAFTPEMQKREEDLWRQVGGLAKGE